MKAFCNNAFTFRRCLCDLYFTQSHTTIATGRPWAAQTPHRKHVELRRLTRGHFERRSILQNDLLFRAAFARSQSSCQWDDLITTKNVYLVNNEQPYRPATKVAVNVNKQISSKCRESNYSAFLFFVEILDSFNHIRVVRRLDQITQRVKRKCQAESKPVCADRPLWP